MEDSIKRRGVSPKESKQEICITEDICVLQQTPSLSKCEERPLGHCKKRGRPCNSNAARERSRVKTLRTAFLELQQTLPSVPPDTKLSKLDVLVLATTYISHLMRTLDGGQAKRSFSSQGFMHPVKKWPMRTRLYAGILGSTDWNQDQTYNNNNFVYSAAVDSVQDWSQ